MSIFQKSVINKYLSGLDRLTVEKAFTKFKENYNAGQIERIRRLIESEFQVDFLRKIFVDVLGYTINIDNKDFDLIREHKNQTDAKKADGAIIRDGKVTAVIELKDTKTKDMGSVTEQAFGYKNSQEGCKYVITSNFHKLRFYIDNKVDFEEFDLFELSRDDFELLYLLLNRDSIFNDIPAKLKEETKFHEETVSGKLYSDYSSFKKNLFGDMTKNNPQYDKLTLFKKSQKLIDRYLFILFSEDRGLLPPNSISRMITRFDVLKSEDSYKPLYEICRQYFGYMNTGNHKENIPAYNGGLFLPDEILDSIKIDDGILRDHLWQLSTYDYATEIDVNILGHIFEHSLSEIEEITATIEGVKTDKAKSKRKKDGVYYTPKYITQYIVENTVGTLCREKRRELGIEQIEFDDTYRKANGFLTEKGKILFDKLEAYKKWLITLKIVDPACGSGAFLNQALNFLIAEHKTIDDIIAELTASPLRLFDTDKAILENNLYGVDINDESVEIAKLSLWLHTARKDRKLSDLNNNIKCGNSLINDPKVAGDKAFDWHKEFPDIMQAGGFDVVIGNPPYVQSRSLDDKTKDEIYKKYRSAEYQINTYGIFIEKSISVLKDKAKYGLIVPNYWLSTQYDEKLRNIVFLENHAESIVNVYNVFGDANVDTLLIIGQKSSKPVFPKNTCIKSISNKIKTIPERLESLNSNKWEFNNNLAIIDLKQNLQISFQKSLNIVSKNKISDFFEGYMGMKPYEEGKGVPAQTRKMMDKKIYNSINRIDDTYYPLIGARNVQRFFLRNPDEYIKYGKNLAAPRKYEIFSIPRLLINRILSKENIDVAFSDEIMINNTDVFNIILKKGESFDLYLLLAIIGSKLCAFYFKTSNVNLDRGAYPKLNVNNILSFPLPENISDSMKAEISNLSQSLLDLNKQLQEKKNKFQSRIKSNFALGKITTKLESFHEHDFKTFVAELKKQKVSPTLKQQDEWEEYFNSYKKEINDLQAEIRKTDADIDQMVYKLYELTEEEIRIVEGSVK